VILFPSHVLREDVHPRVYAYYFRQWNSFDMPFHQHDSTEIMYVISGACRVEVEREGNREQDRFESNEPPSMTLKKGEFILIGGNVPHRLIVQTSCRMLNVEFTFAPHVVLIPSMRKLAMEEPVLTFLLSANVSHTVLRDPVDVYHALKALVLELDASGTDGGTMVHLLFSQLLILIARLYEQAVSASQPLGEQYIRKCIAFLHENYDRDIQMKDIATSVHLHPAYLHRLFKLHTGQTVIEYLTTQRMEKAKMLLERTDMPIEDISGYVGVGSRQYFHALFKRYTGLTPASYREASTKHKFDIRQQSEDF
jgi:AraC-like DNA-binding protein/mannose-6-phosphate isomerase-like protein (cupin superfamily)